MATIDEMVDEIVRDARARGLEMSPSDRVARWLNDGVLTLGLFIDDRCDEDGEEARYPGYARQEVGMVGNVNFEQGFASSNSEKIVFPAVTHSIRIVYMMLYRNGQALMVLPLAKTLYLGPGDEPTIEVNSLMITHAALSHVLSVYAP